MDFEYLLFLLTRFLLCHRAIRIQDTGPAPSLFGLNFNFTDARVMHIANFSINIENHRLSSERTPVLPLTIETRDGARIDLQIAETTPSIQSPPSREEVHEEPMHYHLEPHLVFDRPVERLDEFKIADRAKILLSRSAPTMDFVRCDGLETTQRLYLDPDQRSRPIALRLGGRRIPFNRRTLTWGAAKKQRWTFKPFSLNRPQRIETDPRNPTLPQTLISVLGDVYDAAWMLTQRDLRPAGTFPEHYLLLHQKETGDDDAQSRL